MVSGLLFSLLGSDVGTEDGAAWESTLESKLEPPSEGEWSLGCSDKVGDDSSSEKGSYSSESGNAGSSREFSL